MSVLVYLENIEGKFKKSTFEVISFASAIAQKQNLPLVALSIGEVSDEELGKAGKYGVSKILKAGGDNLKSMNVQSYATVIAQAAKAENAKVVVMSASFSGKGIAPRVAIKLDAGLADNVIDLPVMDGKFLVKKGAYSGKAFAFVEITSDVKVISMIPNSYKVIETPASPSISVFETQLGAKDLAVTVKETKRSTDKVSLPDAELVVSAGRGMKGPENWGMIEELANVLGAATACSKPVSDAGWRPHSEHVGQTGIAISPNLYIAIGISGAIQHLAGVSSSKVIVVVNKDPEAPFFKAADYGIVGDAFEIVPQLIAAAKAFKSSQNG
ncbi:MAG: electron transfer flavoprotein subunit alpha/FixB family protein [Bacteroidetes bacterium]|nr:electron transfer flavoprotein subunit alpha/FixB family protein [Bacteroidota bacterium]MBL0066583.1 electron transfer flavoprotein subunit alpha/FixB family protein [Bacteroidota bacterium]MBL0138763.1 electron transfer flavoprotein subunit alpha/FixB family protein [Bacteroidota bacterium]